MMAWVHATVGAAIGSRAGSRPNAFFAGIVSHLVCDLFPHRDYEIEVEAPLVGAALIVIACRCGIRSPEMIGALGAISPDIENGLERLGVIDWTVFPTHTTNSWRIGHGRRIESPMSQVLLAAVCVAMIEMGRRR